MEGVSLELFVVFFVVVSVDVLALMTRNVRKEAIQVQIWYGQKEQRLYRKFFTLVSVEQVFSCTLLCKRSAVGSVSALVLRLSVNLYAILYCVKSLV